MDILTDQNIVVDMLRVIVSSGTTTIIRMIHVKEYLSLID